MIVSYFEGMPSVLTGDGIMHGRKLIQTLSVGELTGLPESDNATVKSTMDRHVNIQVVGDVVTKPEGPGQVHLMKIAGLGKEFGVAQVKTNGEYVSVEGMYWGERAVVTVRDFVTADNDDNINDNINDSSEK